MAATSTSRKTIAWVAAGLIGLGGLIWLQIQLVEFIADDALIHVRVARHLVENGQPYFNLGDPLKASSSTAWILLVAGFLTFITEALTPLIVTNLILALVAGWLATRLEKQIVPASTVWTRLFVAVGVFAVLWPTSQGLMESVLAVVLLLAGYLGVVRDSRWAWVFFGLAIATRLELSLAVLPAIWFWMRSQRRSVRDWLIAAALGIVAIAPFVVFDLAFYGTVVPHAAIAKGLVYEIGFQDALSLGPLVGTVGSIALVLVALVIGFLPARDELRHRPLLGNALIASGLLVVGFYVATRFPRFSWYAPLGLAPLFLGVVWKGYAIKPPVGRLAGVAFGLPSLLYCVALVLSLTGWQQLTMGSFQARTALYVEVGDAIQRSCGGCTLAASEIGGLGHSFRGWVFDGVGITDGGALKYHPLEVPDQRASGAIGAIPTGYVRETQPDVVVSYEPLMERGMLSALDDYTALVCDPILPEHSARGFLPSLMARDGLYVLLSEGLGRSDADDIRASLDNVVPCRLAG